MWFGYLQLLAEQRTTNIINGQLIGQLAEAYHVLHDIIGIVTPALSGAAGRLQLSAQATS